MVAERMAERSHSKQELVWRALFSAILEALKRDLAARFGPRPEQDGDQPTAFVARIEEAERALYSAFDEMVPGQIHSPRPENLWVTCALRVAPGTSTGVSGADDDVRRYHSFSSRVRFPLSALALRCSGAAMLTVRAVGE